MKLFIRFVLGVIAGAAVYCIGFIIGAILAYVMSVFQLFIPGGSGSINTIRFTGAALAANIAAAVVFSLIYGQDNLEEHPLPAVLFEVLLMVAAVIYGVMQAMSGIYSGIWYSVISCGLCVFFISEFRKGMK